MTLVETRPGAAERFEGPQPFRVPEITGMQSLHPELVGIPKEIAPGLVETFGVRDPYLEAIPLDRRNEIVAQEAAGDAFARARREAGAWQRAPGTAYEDAEGVTHVKTRIQWGDPVSRDAFFGTPEQGERSPALSAWRSLVPDPAALTYLSNSANVTEVVGRNGKVVEATESDREWFAVVTDAQGIRNRGAGMGERIADFVRWHRWQNPNEPIRMLSVACGTALPTMQGAVYAKAPDASLLLTDRNQKAMRGAAELGASIGFRGNIEMQQGDVFDPAYLSSLKEQLTAGGVDNRPHLLDAMGIFEYTGKELRTPDKADSDSLLYDPARFLSSLFDLVRPGGRLIFGQMRDDRPNADFTMGLIGWPYVFMRSPKEVMELVVEAGINPEWVTLTLTPEGLYTIGSIDKPVEFTPPQASVELGIYPRPSEPERKGRLMSGLMNRLSRMRTRHAMARTALEASSSI